MRLLLKRAAVCAHAAAAPLEAQRGGEQRGVGAEIAGRHRAFQVAKWGSVWCGLSEFAERAGGSALTARFSGARKGSIRGAPTGGFEARAVVSRPLPINRSWVLSRRSCRCRDRQSRGVSGHAMCATIMSDWSGLISKYRRQARQAFPWERPPSNDRGRRIHERSAAAAMDRVSTGRCLAPRHHPSGPAYRQPGHD